MKGKSDVLILITDKEKVKGYCCNYCNYMKNLDCRKHNFQLLFTEVLVFKCNDIDWSKSD